MDLPNDCFLVPDGSLVSKNGEIVQYSVGRFVRDVCNGDCCFLCGRNSAGGGKLTDEHVLPKWLLSTGDIFNHTIALSNQAYHRYDRYKVKSCGRCNALLGETLEDPISTIFKGGFDAVSSYVRSEGPHLLYIWLSLVFFKTHLRDATLRWHLDRRYGRDYISNGYDWQSLHHVHCVARIPLTKALLEKNTCGSIWVLPATIGSPLGDFDYLDLYQSQSIAIRLDDFVIIGVLNDCFACANIENESLMPRITGSLSPLQIREIYARISYLNTRITNRPELYTAIRSNRLYITAKFPSTVTASQWEDREYGRLLDSTCGRLLVDGVEGPEQVKEVRDLLTEGKITFLFNDEGKFVLRDDLQRDGVVFAMCGKGQSLIDAASHGVIPRRTLQHRRPTIFRLSRSGGFYRYSSSNDLYRALLQHYNGSLQYYIALLQHYSAVLQHYREPLQDYSDTLQHYRNALQYYRSVLQHYRGVLQCYRSPRKCFREPRQHFGDLQ